jgi:hypothetical protein
LGKVKLLFKLPRLLKSATAFGKMYIKQQEKQLVLYIKKCHTTYTTGFRSFAECLRHSAKPWKHSAKALPGVTPGKGHSVVIIPAKTSLPSAFYRALGKGFAQCQIRHSAKKSRRDGVRTVTALCRAPSVWRSAKTLIFAERPLFGAWQRLALCRVPVTWHSAKGRLCRAPNIGRSAKFRSLCRVPVTWHSAKFRSLCRVLFLYTRQRGFLKDFNLFFSWHFTLAHIDASILYIHTGILFEISHTQPNWRKSYRDNQI